MFALREGTVSSHREQLSASPSDAASTDPSVRDDAQAPVFSTATENRSRRRFLILGAASLPWIVTLQASPVRAADGMGSLGTYGYGDDDRDRDGTMPGDPLGSEPGRDDWFRETQPKSNDPIQNSGGSSSF